MKMSELSREALEGKLREYASRGYAISRDCGFTEGIVTPSGRIHALDGALLSNGGVSRVPEGEVRAVTDIANIIYYLTKKG